MIRFLCLLGSFVLLTSLSVAQVQKPRTTRPAPKRAAPKPAAPRPAMTYTDQLYRLDQSMLAVRIAEVTDTTILYYTATLPGKKQALARREVWKLAFGDGSQLAITPLPTAAPPVAETVAAAPLPPPTEAPSAPVVASTAPAARYPGDKRFSRLHITIGPELALYPATLNKERAWLSDSTGFGMKQNVGGSLRVDVQLVRWAAVSITAGYAGWELVRSYTRDGFSEYTETKRLTQVPLQFGIKLYPVGGLYLLPEGGINLLFSSVKTSVGHPTPADESVSATPLTYGASAGVELRVNSLLLDLSLRYQLLNVKNLRFSGLNQTLNEQVAITAIRVGIGFQSQKK
ncbi:hypothetical protein ACAW74_04385 [Fibrella sp. WM1]|uniref:hypothetical protein n=1 Tax=Fibrella musci TaxID=3242485 RepID=UPI003520AAEE